MDCNNALELLPGYTLGALSDQERSQLEEHLGNELTAGCASCQHEQDQLTAAASLLAESLPPSVPRPQVKHELLKRIDNGQLTARSKTMSNLPEQNWRMYLPYLVATLCAVAVGSSVARFVELPSKNGVDQQTVDQGLDAWRRQIAAAEQTLGEPRIQFAKLESDAASQGLSAAVFYEGLSGELHLLVSNIVSPSADQQLWLWLVDQQDARVTQGPLKYLGQGHAAGVFDLPAERGFAAESAAPKMTFEVIITVEPQHDPTEPTGPVVCRARLSRGS